MHRVVERNEQNIEVFHLNKKPEYPLK